jgi:hypothetical protein
MSQRRIDAETALNLILVEIRDGISFFHLAQAIHCSSRIEQRTGQRSLP